MKNERRTFGRLVDWRAAIIAGLIAGTIFLLLNLLLIPVKLSTSTEVVFRYFASIVMGEHAVSPMREFGGDIIAVAILVHYTLSVLFACVVAFVLHRWGVIVGAIGGALLGVCIYLINLYTFTTIFPWFFSLSGTLFLTFHAIFGAAVGTLYEVMERDSIEAAQGEIDTPPNELHHST